MSFNDMKHKLYKLYMLDWLMAHGYGLDDFLKAVEKYRDKDNGCFEAYVAWYSNGGFPDGVWVNFYEFCDNELNEYEDMIWLINNTIDNEELLETYNEWYESEN